MAETQAKINLTAVDNASPEIQQATLNIVRMKEATADAQQAAKQFGQTVLVPPGSASGLDDTRKSMEDFMKATGDATGGMGGFSLSMVTSVAAGIGLATTVRAAVQSLMDFAKGSVEAADKMQGVHTLASVVFGDDMPQMQASANSLATELHRSANDMLAYETNLALIGEGMGLSKTQAEQLGGQMSELAVDIGKARHIADQDVLSALQRGIEGSYRSLLQLGIVVNNHVLDQYLLQKGSTETMAKLDEESQARVRAQYILENSTQLIQAANENTGSYDDTVKQLTASWHDLMVQLGTDVLPAVTATFSGINAVLHDTAGEVVAVSNDVKDLFSLFNVVSGGAIGDYLGGVGARFNQIMGGGKSIDNTVNTGDSGFGAPGAVPSGNAELDSQMQALNSQAAAAAEAAKKNKAFVDSLHAVGGSGGGAGKAASELKALQDQMTSLGDTYDNEVTKINDNLANLEIAHRDKLRTIDDQIDAAGQKIGEIGEKYADAMGKMTEAHVKAQGDVVEGQADAIAGQEKNVADLDRQMADIKYKAGGNFSEDKVVTTLANRMDKEGAYTEVLSARDAAMFHLNQQEEDYINLLLREQKEKAALEAVDKNLGVTAPAQDDAAKQALKDAEASVNGLQKQIELRKKIAGETSDASNVNGRNLYTGDAASLLNGMGGPGGLEALLKEAQDNLAKLQGTSGDASPVSKDMDAARKKAGETSFEQKIDADAKKGQDENTKFAQDAKEKRDAFNAEMQKAQQQVDKLKEKKQAEIDAYSAQRAQMEQSKVALTQFHDHYVAMLDDMTKVTKEQVKAMTDGLKDLQNAITAANTSTKKGGTITPSDGLQKFASGGVSSGGWAVVGEDGPEVVALPGGSRVYNTQDSQKMMGGQQVTVNLGPVYVSKEVDGDALISRITRAIQLQSYASAPA